MTMLGLDIDAARQMARTFAQQADAIKSATSTMTSQLQGVQWVGTDSQTFKSAWEGTAVQQLNQIAEMITNQGVSIGKQADQQEATSQS